MDISKSNKYFKRWRVLEQASKYFKTLGKEWAYCSLLISPEVSQSSQHSISLLNPLNGYFFQTENLSE
jgi:hypothetical protein